MVSHHLVSLTPALGRGGVGAEPWDNLEGHQCGGELRWKRPWRAVLPHL